MVKQKFFTISILFVGATLSLIGCISSGETGAGDRAKTPVQIFGPIDTTHRSARPELQQTAASKLKIDSAKLIAIKPPRNAPKFKSKQDTIKASVITKSKSYSHTFNKPEISEHQFYTVQIGAFGQASNALRAQKKAKKQFSDYPVFNKFIRSIKLYRVSIGRYEDLKDAFVLANTMKENYPTVYHKCWINFIP